MLAGCGGGGNGPGGNPPPPPPPNDPPAPAPAGCGEFCDQAGPVGGDEARSTTEVLDCAHEDYGCVEQLTTSADVEDGVVSVDLRCDAPDPCEGALVIYSGVFARLGGADFSMGPGATAAVHVGLVDDWQELVAKGSSGAPSAATFIWLIGPGDEALIDGGKPLTLTPAP